MNCSGCKQLRDYSSHADKINLECRYTLFSVKSLKNCPCGQCIIKTLCSERCQEFTTEYNKHYKNGEGLMSFRKTVR